MAVHILSALMELESQFGDPTAMVDDVIKFLLIVSSVKNYLKDV